MPKRICDLWLIMSLALKFAARAATAVTTNFVHLCACVCAFRFAFFPIKHRTLFSEQVLVAMNASESQVSVDSCILEFDCWHLAARRSLGRLSQIVSALFPPRRLLSPLALLKWRFQYSCVTHEWNYCYCMYSWLSAIRYFLRQCDAVVVTALTRHINK